MCADRPPLYFAASQKKSRVSGRKRNRKTGELKSTANSPRADVIIFTHEQLYTIALIDKTRGAESAQPVNRECTLARRIADRAQRPDPASVPGMKLDVLSRANFNKVSPRYKTARNLAVGDFIATAKLHS